MEKWHEVEARMEKVVLRVVMMLVMVRVVAMVVKWLKDAKSQYKMVTAEDGRLRTSLRE